MYPSRQGHQPDGFGGQSPTQAPPDADLPYGQRSLGATTDAPTTGYGPAPAAKPEATLPDEAPPTVVDDHPPTIVDRRSGGAPAASAPVAAAGRGAGASAAAEGRANLPPGTELTPADIAAQRRSQAMALDMAPEEGSLDAAENHHQMRSNSRAFEKVRPTSDIDIYMHEWVSVGPRERWTQPPPHGFVAADGNYMVWGNDALSPQAALARSMRPGAGRAPADGGAPVVEQPPDVAGAAPVDPALDQTAAAPATGQGGAVAPPRGPVDAHAQTGVADAGPAAAVPPRGGPAGIRDLPPGTVLDPAEIQARRALQQQYLHSFRGTNLDPGTAEAFINMYREVSDPEIYQLEWLEVGSGPMPPHGFVNREGHVRVWANRSETPAEALARVRAEAAADHAAGGERRTGGNADHPPHGPAERAPARGAPGGEPGGSASAADSASPELAQTVRAEAPAGDAAASSHGPPASTPRTPSAGAAEDAVVPTEGSSGILSESVPLGPALEVVGGIDQTMTGVDQLHRAGTQWSQGDHAGAVNTGSEGALNTGGGLMTTAGGAATAIGLEGGAVLSTAALPLAGAAATIAADRAGNEHLRETGALGDREGVEGSREAGQHQAVHRSADDVANEAGDTVGGHFGTFTGALTAAGVRLGLLPVTVAAGLQAARQWLEANADRHAAEHGGTTVTADMAELEQRLVAITHSPTFASMVVARVRIALVVTHNVMAAGAAIADSGGRSDTTDIEAADQEARNAPEQDPQRVRNPHERERVTRINSHRHRIRDRNQQDRAQATSVLHDRGTADSMNSQLGATEFTPIAQVHDGVPDDAALADRQWVQIESTCASYRAQEDRVFARIRAGLEQGGEDGVTAAVHAIDGFHGAARLWGAKLRDGKALAERTGKHLDNLPHPSLATWTQLGAQVHEAAAAEDIAFDAAAFVGPIRHAFDGL